jgi:hypothetical protein
MDYCKIEGRKRLMAQGFDIIKAIEMTEEVGKLINGKNIQSNGQQCGCKTGKPSS